MLLHACQVLRQGIASRGSTIKSWGSEREELFDNPNVNFVIAHRHISFISFNFQLHFLLPNLSKLNFSNLMAPTPFQKQL